MGFAEVLTSIEDEALGENLQRHLLEDHLLVKELKPMDEAVSKMIDCSVEPNGKLNYVLYAFCLRTVEPSYNNYKNFCGELRQCATEIERRILAPYEDKAIERNGDVEGSFITEIQIESICMGCTDPLCRTCDRKSDVVK